MKATLKEKVKSVPKELARRGLDSGVDRLRTQLRDTAQEGRDDQQGGDSIEDAAAGGLRQAERGVERLLKRRPADRAMPKERTADAPEGRGGTPRLPADQVGEPAAKESPASGKSSGEGPRTRPWRVARQQAAASGNSGRPIIKTKDTFIQGQTATPTSQAGVAHTQGGGEFIREQGRGAVKTARSPRQAVSAADRPTTAVKQTARSTGRATAKPAKGTVKNAQRTVKTAGRASKTAVKTAERTSKTAIKTAQATAKTTQQATQAAVRASKVAVHTARATAKAAATAAKATAKTVAASVKAMIAGAKALVTAIAAGGWVAVLVVIVICLIGLLVASPFGIFFSGEDSGTGYAMPEAVLQLNGEFTDRIEQIKADNVYDTLDLDNAGSAAMVSNWADVLAVYAVRTSTDPIAPEEVATLTEAKLSSLREIFWDMNVISHWLEIIPGDEEEGESDTIVLHITVTIKNHLQMAEEYGFTAEQRALLAELMEPENQELFQRLTGSYRDITLSPAEVREILAQLPEDLGEARRQVVLTAYQLLGKVNYFWGGKSLVSGWDSRWGTPMEVWAEGSSTTGTLRPFGLDCSGYVDWVFYNVTGGEYVIGHGGGASAQHSYCTDITWDEAQPGDLVFYPGDSHVGIICGFDGSGPPSLSTAPAVRTTWWSPACPALLPWQDHGGMWDDFL